LSFSFCACLRLRCAGCAFQMYNALAKTKSLRLYANHCYALVDVSGVIMASNASAWDNRARHDTALHVTGKCASFVHSFTFVRIPVLLRKPLLSALLSDPLLSVLLSEPLQCVVE
jgi:hypothetical protein